MRITRIEQLIKGNKYKKTYSHVKGYTEIFTALSNPYKKQGGIDDWWIDTEKGTIALADMGVIPYDDGRINLTNYVEEYYEEEESKTTRAAKQIHEGQYYRLRPGGKIVRIDSEPVRRDHSTEEAWWVMINGSHCSLGDMGIIPYPNGWHDTNTAEQVYINEHERATRDYWKEAERLEEAIRKLNIRVQTLEMATRRGR